MARRLNEKRTLYWATTALALLAGVGGAYAQDASSEPEGVEDIVVTAERREQRLQDLPIAATVVSGETLRRQGVNDVQSLSSVAPSLNITVAGPVNAYVNVRGIGANVFSTSRAPGVAYFLDGGIVFQTTTLQSAFYDIDSVEVLRGPQGTLVGQNSTGGAIMTRSVAPRLGEWSGVLSQTIGDYSFSRTEGGLNIPFGDRVAVRVAGLATSRDSFSTNVGGSGSTPGDANTEALRVSALFEPSDDLRITLRQENYRVHHDSNDAKRVNDPIGPDPRTIAYNIPTAYELEGHRTSIEANFDLVDWATLRYITLYEYGRFIQKQDSDFTASPADRTRRVNDAATDIWTHEINLVSRGDGPLQWVLGYYDLDVILPSATTIESFATLPPTSSGFNIGEIPIESSSVFGQLNYHILPNLEIVAGVRYNEDTFTQNRILPVPDLASTEGSATTWRTAVSWTVDPDVTFYGSVARGYKYGVVNQRAQVIAGAGSVPQIVDPEFNTVYEIGAKTMLWDRRLRLNAALFQSHYQGMQIQSSIAFGPSFLFYDFNAADATTYGAEIELEGRFDNFSFTGGVGYLNAGFDEPFIAADRINGGVPTVIPKGRHLPYAPEWTANMTLRYDFLLGDNILTPSIRMFYLSDQYARVFSDPANDLLAARTVIDARLTFETANDVVVEGFVTNVTDEVYRAGAVTGTSAASPTVHFYGAPRQIGLRLGYRF